MADLLRNGQYTCQVCYCTFSRYKKLQQHMISSHTAEENLLYGDVFPMAQQVMPREVKAKRKKKQVCPVCHRRYAHVGHWKKHLWLVHGISKGKEKNRGYMGRVKRVAHQLDKSSGKDKSTSSLGTERKSECPSTLQKLPEDTVGTIGERGQQSTWLSSKKIDTEGKTYYECPECNKRLKHRTTLKAHRRIHTGERPYQCSKCQKTFTFYQCLWNHFRIHTNEKRFPCDVCPRRYCYYQCLWQHYKKHTGEKPYECDLCKLRCSSISQLSCHIKKHRKDLPQAIHDKVLNICRPYSRKEFVEMPFVCEVCHRKFRLKVSLQWHMRKFHSIDDLRKQPVFPPEKKNASSNMESDGLSMAEVKGNTQHQNRVCNRPRALTRQKMAAGKASFNNTMHSKTQTRGQDHICRTCKKKLVDCICRAVHEEYERAKACEISCTTIDVSLSGIQRQEVESDYEKCGVLHAEVIPSKIEDDIFPQAHLRRSLRVAGKKAEILECRPCAQWFTSAIEQQQHLKHHESLKPYKCHKCNETFKSPSYLARHCQRSHVKKGRPLQHNEAPLPYKCHKCNESFRFPSYLLQHRQHSHERKGRSSPRRKQGNGKQHKCLHCGTVFISLSLFKKHTACITCKCKQSFFCCYIFCTHTVTCTGENVLSKGDTTDLNPERNSTCEVGSQTEKVDHSESYSLDTSSLLAVDNCKPLNEYYDLNPYVSASTDDYSHSSVICVEDRHEECSWQPHSRTLNLEELDMISNMEEEELSSLMNTDDDPSQLDSGPDACNCHEIKLSMKEKGQRFRCGMCSQEFSSVIQFVNHAMEPHNGGLKSD